MFVIVMENHEYGDIIGNADAPYINGIARQYGVAVNDFAITHPSLPNYMALTAGDTFFIDDCIGCTTAAANLMDRIEASGRTWKAYMEDMPSPCAASDAGLYTARHNPFVHYSDILGSPRCTNGVVPFSTFSSDLAANQLASFVWITPNVCNDMHDCSVASGDAWLASVVPQILQSPAFANSVLFLTWDEGTSNTAGGGHVPLIVASARTPAGFQSATVATHYSLLRTIEDAWGLTPLGESANATSLSQFFPSSPAAPSEQVVYAGDVTAMTGLWTKVSDPTAAVGVKLSTPDNGGPTGTTPQAMPSSYFDAAFQASAATRYRVWLRMHATGDSKWNDSVFVQFSDSVDAAGSPVYRIGTTAGYIVNLWTCATCQSFGWGWQRNAYWLSDSGDVWFPTGGTHTIRIQPREDGVEIDQIVISPVQYAVTAPGAVSGDTTIVPKPSPGLPPSVPSSPNVTNGATGVGTSLILTWTADGATSYDVNFGSSNPPLPAAAGLPTNAWGPGPLSNTATYFWQIVARNSAGAVIGPVWSFTTAPPATVSSPSPADRASQMSLTPTLSWITSGSLNYQEVYFGTSSPPPLVQARNTTGSYAPGTLASNTTYFWKIVTHDNSGATTTGPVWTFTIAPLQPPTIVIYASDIPPSARHGSWATAGDPTSPNGIKLVTPDVGVATTANPLSAPVDYLDIPFTANANTPYAIWLRMQATGNSKWNDSIWVQFSDALTAGATVYPWDTTSGLLVNLATDAGAASLSGWGWQNTAYWQSQATTVTFATSGTHTLRIQVREDGVQLDQIVLSPGTYLNLPPGGPTNDSTILPKS